MRGENQREGESKELGLDNERIKYLVEARGGKGVLTINTGCTFDGIKYVKF